MTQAKRDKMSPDDVLALMKKGNKRFAAGQRQDHNYSLSNAPPRPASMPLPCC